MSDFPDFIRVRVKDSGTEQTIAKPSALDPERYELLEGPAVDSNGRPLPPKLPGSGRTESREALGQIPVPVLNKPDPVTAPAAGDNSKES